MFSRVLTYLSHYFYFSTFFLIIYFYITFILFYFYSLNINQIVGDEMLIILFKLLLT